MAQPLDWLVGYYTSMIWQANFDDREEIEKMLRHLIAEAQTPFNIQKSKEA
jgi:hypothetical protein